MKRKLITIGIILLSVVSIFCNDTDVLWKKAETFLKNGWNLVPGNISSEMVMLDKKGVAQSRTEISYKTNQEAEGISVSFLSGTNANGELSDDSPEVQAGLQKDYTPDEDSFFSRATKHKFLATEKVIESKVCIAYEFEADTDNDEKESIQIGKIWIEKNTGYPVLAEYEVSPLPAKVKEISIKTYYKIIDNDYATVERREVFTLVKWMLMKFRVQMNETFSNYWKYASN